MKSSQLLPMDILRQVACCSGLVIVLVVSCCWHRAVVTFNNRVQDDDISEILAKGHVFKWRYPATEHLSTLQRLLLGSYCLRADRSEFIENQICNNISRAPTINSWKMTQSKAMRFHILRESNVHCSRIVRYQANLNASAMVIVIEGCTATHNSLNFESIYGYYDEIRLLVATLRRKFSNALIVWAMPPVLNHESTDLRRLHRFIMSKYLIASDGIFALTMARYTANPSAEIDKIIHQLLYILSHYNWNFDQVAHEKNTLDAVVNRASQIIHGFFPLESSSSLKLICRHVSNSRKYEPRCLPEPKVLLPVLVTGLGGSGTHNITNMLTGLGLRIAHEGLGVHGSVCWMYAVNDRLGAPPLQYQHHAKLRHSSFFSPRFERVIHVVREPLQQISAFTSHLPQSYAFVRAHMLAANDTLILSRINEVQLSRHSAGGRNCPRGDRCNLHFASLSWVFWNKHLSSYADATYRVDEMDAVLRDVCAFIVTGEPHTNSRCFMRSTEPGKSAQKTQPMNMSPWGEGSPRLLSPPDNTKTLSQRRVATALRPFSGDLRGFSPADGTVYKSSPAHKLHSEYSLDDIRALDPTLADTISDMARAYGFK